MYDAMSCDLVTCGTGSEIFRLNLDRGMFLKPMQSSCPSLNVRCILLSFHRNERSFHVCLIKCCGINPQNALYAFGGEDGIAEFVDPRSRKPIGFLDVGEQTRRLSFGVVTGKSEVTAVRYHQEGLHVALGTSTGQVLLYDLRSR